MVALGSYLHNNVSTGYSAEIAGLSEEEFMLFLGQNNIDVFRVEDDELMRDVANAEGHSEFNPTDFTVQSRPVRSPEKAVW